MEYKKIVKATFISRPNRFVAICDINGEKEVCHVKNTGRCRELLTENATVYLEESDNTLRKTKYDLVAVMKNDVIFNIDSQAPNKVFYEWLKDGNLFDDITYIKPEAKYKNSRIDFYVERKKRKAFIEVKGVTLEKDGVLLFPDAPTERGVKHITELCKAVEEGYDAYIAFVVQTEKAKYFTPSADTHKEFADALRYAREKGVNIICLNCNVTPESLTINDYVKIIL